MGGYGNIPMPANRGLAQRAKLPMPKVREAIRIVGNDGWRLDRMKGSHRQFKHPVKIGTVTTPGYPGDDLKTKTWRSILRQAGIREGNL